MKKWVLIVTLIGVMSLIGCRAFMNGFTGETPNQLSPKIEEIKKDAALGNVDMSKVLEALSIVEKDLDKEKKTKMSWWEMLVYMVGVSAGTYLGTRQLRQGTIGTVIAGLFGMKKTS